ncbi:hypothetical protein [Streptomyces sp. MMS20-AI2-20]|uniref:hypothetical protein n=1 Tax=Streptomyces sp. MMS20-AI2-20 TaxID=2925835 RepID=UPI001F60F68F|nr:hypothetical protein [Streptomyces sp. MMS20-AI2-20]MCI4143032.1 hypothetical protein [Streptomyces sp. MMS20-AI2-20]
MSTLDPQARAVVRAVDALTDQARRIADTLAAGQQHTDEPALPCGAVPGCDDQCCKRAPSAEDEQRRARRDSAFNLLGRLERTDLTADEKALLREHLEAEMRDVDTARAVAAGNLRHVRMLYADLQTAQAKAGDVAEKLRAERRRADQADELSRIAHETANKAEAALERVRAARDRMARSRGADAIWCLDVLEAALKPTEPAETETTARVFAALHRSAEQDVSRVIALYERWLKTGPPPLGTSVSRWWDARLAELHNAIRPPDDKPTER